MISVPKQFGDNPWTAMGLVGTIGVTTAATLYGGYALGQALETRFDLAGLSMIGMVVGLAIGVISAIQFIRMYLN